MGFLASQDGKVGGKRATFAEDGPLSTKALFTCGKSSTKLSPRVLFLERDLVAIFLCSDLYINIDMDGKTLVVDAAQIADVQMQDTSAEQAEPQHADVNTKKRPREIDDDEEPRPGQNINTHADLHAEAPTYNDHSGQKTDIAEHRDLDQPKLSKNQLRKQRQQRLREERKVERKLLRKDRRHEKTARRRLERDEQAEALAKSLGIEKEAALRKIAADEASSKNTKPAVKSRPVPVAFIIDCDFEKYMRENELISLSGQITRSYSMNRNGMYQAHIVVSSWGGKLKERFDGPMKGTYVNWKGVNFVERDFVEAGKTAWEVMNGPRGGRTCPALEGEKGAEEQKTEYADTKAQQPTTEPPIDDTPANFEIQDAVKDCNSNETPADAEARDSSKHTTSKDHPAGPEFSTSSIVYLSADSPHTLDKLEPYTSYVIGGLVDRNREKNLCQRRAEEKGIRTAKLPIGEYMQMADRKVLATNHVVEIMSKWLETGDWGKAFVEIIPKRKGGRLKGEGGDEEAGEEADVKDDEGGAGDGSCDEQDKDGRDEQVVEAQATDANETST